MSHTLWQEKLTVVVSRQQDGDILAKSGAATTNINCNIKHTTLYHSH